MPEVDDEDAGTENEVDEAEETSPEGDDEGAEQLGDAGKKALDRMKQQLRQEKRLRKEAQAKAEQAKPKSDDADKPDLEQVRRQAREEAAAEALRDRALDKIEAKARKFADPEDAAAILLRSRQVEDFIDGGKVDAEAITEALDELAEAKPHLLSRQSPGAGQFDSGRGKKSEKGQLSREDLKGMTSPQIEAARKAGRLDRLMGKTK